VAPGLLVGRQHVHHVATVVVPTDVQQAFDVLDFAERFDHVGSRVLADEPDPRTEVVEHVVLDGVDAVILQHRHGVVPVRLQAVSVRRPADDGRPLRAQLARQFTGSDVRTDPDVVEDHDVGPLDRRAPVVGFRDKPIADLPVLLRLNVVL